MRSRSVFLVAVILLIACKREEEAVSYIEKARARRNTSVVPGQVKILVLGDAFGTDNKAAFDAIVSRVKGATAKITQFSGVTLDVDQVLIPTDPGVTKLGLTYNNQRTKCWIDRPANYGDLITAESEGKIADYVIVAFYGAELGGCSDDDAITISRLTGPAEISHELGHSLAGLYDEGCLTGDQAMYPAAPCIGDHNCSSDKQHLAWPNNGAVTDPYYPGCNGYCDGIYAPTPSCRMNSAGDEFCKVCQTILHDAIGYYVRNGTTLQASSCSKETLTLQPVSTSFVRAHIRITGGVVTVSDVSSGYGSRRPELVASNGLVAITVDGQVRAVAPLNERPFFARSFAMTNGTFDETVVPTGTVDFTVEIPALTIDDLQKENFNIKARLLSTGIGRAIGVTSRELSKSTQDLQGQEFALGNDFKQYLLSH